MGSSSFLSPESPGDRTGVYGGMLLAGQHLEQKSSKVWRFFWKIPPKPSGVSGKPIQELKNHTLSRTHFLKFPHSC